MIRPKIKNMVSYINSEMFRLDTMVHREGNRYVYMEAIPSNKRKEIRWWNGYLMNCKCVVKHVGTREQIADLIAKHLKITKIDKELTEHLGHQYLTDEYIELDWALKNLPMVVNSMEVAKHV